MTLLMTLTDLWRSFLIPWMVLFSLFFKTYCIYNVRSKVQRSDICVSNCFYRMEGLLHDAQHDLLAIAVFVAGDGRGTHQSSDSTCPFAARSVVQHKDVAAWAEEVHCTAVYSNPRCPRCTQYTVSGCHCLCIFCAVLLSCVDYAFNLIWQLP